MADKKLKLDWRKQGNYKQDDLSKVKKKNKNMVRKVSRVTKNISPSISSQEDSSNVRRGSEGFSAGFSDDHDGHEAQMVSSNVLIIIVLFKTSRRHNRYWKGYPLLKAYFWSIITE